MTNTHIKAELVVLGGGPGGYPAAFLAADLGMNVILVEPEENPGGACLYRGCIPSKALLHAAKIIRHAAEAESLGISFDQPRIDLDRLRAATGKVVSDLTGGVGQLARGRKIRHIKTRGRLEDEHTVRLEQETDGVETIAFDALILATGSSPNRLSFAPDSHRIWSSDQALALPEIPNRLLVVGGGYIGLELGTVYAALGSRVTVAEMANTLLPGVDPDLSRPLSKRLAPQFENILLETRVASFSEHGEGLQVVFEPETADESARAAFDACLVAIGRHPNTAGLGLEAAGVAVDDRGFVTTDARLRTTAPSIYAIGDIIGPPMLAHTATHQGRVAVEVIHGRDVAYEPRAYPAVVFTDPEISWCGLTEQAAKAQGTPVSILRFPHTASGRARTLGDVRGLTKLVTEEGTGRVLGAGIVGPDAGELISEAVLAVELGATAADLSLSIHPHPTMSETLMEAGEMHAGFCTHYKASRGGRSR